MEPLAQGQALTTGEGRKLFGINLGSQLKHRLEQMGLQVLSQVI